MAQPWLSDLNKLIDGLNVHDIDTSGISAKHFFSGAAAYLAGQIFMSLSPAGLALKLSEEDCAELMSLDGKPLQYFEKSPIKKGYAVLPQSLAEDETARAVWIKRSLDHAEESNKTQA